MSESDRIKTLYIFRHGETDWNREGRMQGGTDIALNDLGRAQARILTDFFARNPVDVFLSSDLSRARETAHIARGSAETPILTDPRLRETNLGHAEGLTVAEVEARFGKDVLEKWRNVGHQYENFSFPGGESRVQHLARVLEGLEEFLLSTTHRRIGVASHGGAMRRLIHHMAPDLQNPVMVGNCVTYHVRFDPISKFWEIDLEPVCVAHSDSSTAAMKRWP